jgi:GNAT superfamily N-acetyltransferase
VVHGTHRGRGLGREVHDGVVERALEWGDVDVLRLGIVATKAAVAEPSWHALGYRPTGEVTPYDSGDVSSSTAIWERGLAT